MYPFKILLALVGIGLVQAVCLSASKVHANKHSANMSSRFLSSALLKAWTLPTRLTRSSTSTGLSRSTTPPPPTISTSPAPSRMSSAAWPRLTPRLPPISTRPWATSSSPVMLPATPSQPTATSSATSRTIYVSRTAST